MHFLNNLYKTSKSIYIRNKNAVRRVEDAVKHKHETKNEVADQNAPSTSNKQFEEKRAMKRSIDTTLEAPPVPTKPKEQTADEKRLHKQVLREEKKRLAEEKSMKRRLKLEIKPDRDFKEHKRRVQKRISTAFK